MRAPIGLALLCLTTFACAQVDKFDAHCVDVTFLQSKKLQKEIGLSESQRNKMNAAVARQRKAAEEHIKRDKPDMQSTNDPTMIKIMADLRQDILDQLTPAQTKRTREVSLQIRGLEAIADQQVAERVGLTPKNLDAYRKALGDGANAMGKVSRDAVIQIMTKYRGIKPKSEAEGAKLQEQAQKELLAAQKKNEPILRGMRDKLSATLNALLTPTQKAKWKELLGAPFQP